MGRKKIPLEEKKVKISITIDVELNKKIDAITYNKSKFIEELVIKYMDKDGK
jgi:metal-responsive CopG/Arc/MetJ family transcriptional regulator